MDRTCTKCLELKPIELFHRNPGSRGGFRGDCAACVSERQAANRKANVDREQLKQAARYKKSKVKCECGAHKDRNSDNCASCARKLRSSWYQNTQGYMTKTVDGRYLLQHRVVMEQLMGRELLSHETVHHKNGIRDDNSPDNLELWSRSQPAGQRVEDKLVWCKWFIAQYGI